MSDLWGLLRSRQMGILATIKRDGRPQLSTVIYAIDPVEPLLRVSITDTRAKTHNMRRDPRVALHVPTEDLWDYVVAEADAELSPVAAAPDDPTVDELIEVYRAISGSEHPDWDDYRRAMVEDKRLVLHLRVDRLYGRSG
jgi:PPOX class probable F420-dependent enzyme